MQSSAQKITYALPPQLTSESAETLVESLLKLSLGDKPSVLIDAGAVENVSSSGVQVLLSLEKTITAAEGEIEITGKKELLSSIFLEMGLGWLVNILR